MANSDPDAVIHLCRDNVYSISAVWALALAYRRVHDKEEEKVS